MRYYPGCTTDPKWIAEYIAAVKAFLEERKKERREVEESKTRV